MELKQRRLLERAVRLSTPAGAFLFVRGGIHLRYLLIAMCMTLILATPAQANSRWNSECRGYSPAKTVECVAVKQQPPGGVNEALEVWRCESNFGLEPPHYDSYHGPFQYAIGTYTYQRFEMPDVTRWFDLSVLVHDMRSNIVLAVAWAAHYSWGPWSCA